MGIRIGSSRRHCVAQAPLIPVSIFTAAPPVAAEDDPAERARDRHEDFVDRVVAVRRGWAFRHSCAFWPSSSQRTWIFMPLSSVARPLKWTSLSLRTSIAGGSISSLATPMSSSRMPFRWTVVVAVHADRRLHHLLVGRDRAAGDQHRRGDKGRSGQKLLSHSPSMELGYNCYCAARPGHGLVPRSGFWVNHGMANRNRRGDFPARISDHCCKSTTGSRTHWKTAVFRVPGAPGGAGFRGENATSAPLPGPATIGIAEAGDRSTCH